MFGFGKKQLQITIEKLNFSPGDTIRGKVTLALKNPTHAKSLKVGIFGERRTTAVTSTFGGGVPGRMPTTARSNMKVFEFEMPLDGEKDYSQGEYNFEMKVPGNITNPSLPNNALGDILKTAQILAGRESDVRWYVMAKLDMSMKMDINDKVQINIG